MTSSSNSAPPGGNIFFTMENLAFAMPLILVCSCYAFFTVVPTKIALSIVFGIIIIFFIRYQMNALHAKKLQNLDEKTVRELVGDDEDDDNDLFDDDEDNSNKKLSKKEMQKLKQQKKSKGQLQKRLAEEKKQKGKKNKSSNNNDDDDDEDEDDKENLMTFVKGKKKN